MIKSYTPEEINKCITMLENMANASELIAHIPESQRIALISAAGRVSHPDKKYLKQRRKEINKIKRQPIITQDRQARANTGIRSARESDLFQPPAQITVICSNQDQDNSIKRQLNLPPQSQLNLPPQSQLNSPRNCYICKAKYTTLHHFYDAMCPECAEFNYHKRFQIVSLVDQVALITGARLKIGYQTTLMILRAGARVIATTRFPVDAAIRYSKEKDFDKWRDRLNIYGLDLRHIPSVEIFAKYIENNYHRLDIIINNAAQTVRRPSGFYAHLMDNENLTFEELHKAHGNEVIKLLENYSICKNQLNSIPLNTRLIQELTPYNFYSCDESAKTEDIFPKGKLDMDLQQVDLRETNSWRLKLGEIDTSEMVEVQLVNSIAPFVLCNRLLDLMKRDYTGQKHIVNVTAMEGKFHRFKQASRHPHTNMAKAALNMMTHTAAADLAKYGIYINAVDTGWVTDEDPIALAKKKEEIHDFQPPLDIVDGAARICDPFFNGILTGKHWCGKFLKDYKPIDW